MPSPTDQARAAFDAVAEDLVAGRDVQRASMFGMPSLKRRGGKAFAGLYGDDMVFKLTDADARERALALPGAHRFAPMEGREMKEWVVAPQAQSEHRPELAEAAVAGL